MVYGIVGVVALLVLLCLGGLFLLLVGLAVMSRRKPPKCAPGCGSGPQPSATIRGVKASNADDDYIDGGMLERMAERYRQRKQEEREERESREFVEALGYTASE